MQERKSLQELSKPLSCEPQLFSTHVTHALGSWLERQLV